MEMKDNIISKAKNAAESMFNFPRIDSNLEVWLILDGKEFEVSQFSIQFGQGVDYKGQPQHEARGGRILLTLSQSVPDYIYKWALTSSVKEGIVEFRSKSESSPLKVEFMDAYCINFNRIIDAFGGLSTAFIISPAEITINGIILENHWV